MSDELSDSEGFSIHALEQASAACNDLAKILSSYYTSLLGGGVAEGTASILCAQLQATLLSSFAS